MRLVVFGAAGRSGRPLVQQALAAGHQVVGFARDPSRVGIAHERLRIVQGDVRKPAQVGEVVAGAEAVLSTLGHTPQSGKDVLSAGTHHIVEAMQRHRVRRLVVLSGAAVRYERDPAYLPARLIGGLMHLVARDLIRDSEQMLEVLRNSGLDWTFVRAPRLAEGPYTGRYRTGYFKLGMVEISRADVADFMLRVVDEGTYLDEAPMIAPDPRG